MPLIRLLDAVGLGMIVEMPTGVMYSNQTGGASCLHPRVEGLYVPLANDCTESWELISPERRLAGFFEGPKHRGTGATRGFDEEDASFIEQTLAEARLSHVLQLDRSRLRDSHEAWVHVLLLGDDTGSAPLFSGLGPYPRRAVLTWGNSD
jgi:hypothetical protein